MIKGRYFKYIISLPLKCILATFPLNPNRGNDFSRGKL